MVFKIQVDVRHHLGGPACDIDGRLSEILAATLQTQRTVDDMNERLSAAVAALIEEAADSAGKLESIRAFIVGVPELVATAVAEALANADVEAEAAAAEVDAARATISDRVDDALAAIDNEPGEDTQSGEDMQAGGEDTADGAGGSNDEI